MGPLPDGRMAVLAPIVPMEQCTVVDDWADNSIGLRASGSNTVVVDDAFVPDHLVVDGNWLGASTRPRDRRASWSTRRRCTSGAR